MDVRQSCGPFRAVDGGAAGYPEERGDGQVRCAGLSEDATGGAADNSSKSRIGRESFVGVLRNFFHRPPKALHRVNGAAAAPSVPDGSAAIRSADTEPAHRTQSRSGGSQSAEGGTNFLEGVDDLAAELHSDRLVGLGSNDAECEGGPQEVLWMRAGDPTLRVATIRGRAADKSANLIDEQIETVDEIEIALQEGFHLSRGNPKRPRPSELAPRPLRVWTVWTNPLCG
jgi:hypothetical protein